MAEPLAARVREAIARGDLDDATHLLGQPHRISGVVVVGDRRGRTLGFPTCNLSGVEEALPPFGVYAVLVVNAPVFTAPLAGFVPLQPPEAVHDVALVELQVSVEVPPLAIRLWLAVSVAVGKGLAGVTVTVAPAAALVPPEPVQVSE